MPLKFIRYLYLLTLFLFFFSTLLLPGSTHAYDIAGLEKSDTTFSVAVLYWSMNIPGQVAMRQGLERRAEEINQSARRSGKKSITLIDRVAGDGPQGIENQIRQMNEIIDMRPDLIIVQPTDNAALAMPLQKANKVGIPVVAYDQYISGGHLTCYVTSDNYQAGYLDGEYMASHFPDNQTLKLILVEYPHVSSTVERVDGFLDALHQCGQPYRILNVYQAVEPVGGLKAGNDILRDFPEPSSVDAIFTVNDGGGLNVVDVLSKAGRCEIFVATIDGDSASIENIRRGNLTRIDCAQFCGAIGSQAMDISWQILQGQEKIPFQITVPVFPVAKETLDIYPGWLGKLPANFEKPWKSCNPVWKGNTRQTFHEQHSEPQLEPMTGSSND